MSGYSVDILNNIRQNLNDEYTSRIPEATQNNLNEIGQALQSYPVQFNEFIECLINKIGKTIIEQKMFKNRLSRFKSGGVTSALDVEEIFIQMAKAEGSYDKDGSNPLGRREPPDVKTIYHRQNRQDYYAISIGDIDFIKSFRSTSSLDEFIKGLINSVYSADAYDEWVAMKNLIGNYKNLNGECGYFAYEVTDIDNSSHQEFAKNFVKTLRKAVNDLTFMSTDYNVSGVKTQSNIENLVLLVNKDVVTEVDVELLSKAFHTSHTDMKVVPTIVVMDNFGSLEDTYAILCDKDFFRIWDTLFTMEPQRNAQGLFTNYFLHHHQILSLSTFKNAVRLKKGNSEGGNG